MTRAGVIGGGAWGTALAQVCARAGLETILWAREADVVRGVNLDHENTSFLAGVEIDPSIRATGDFADLAGCDLVPSTFAPRSPPSRRTPATACPSCCAPRASSRAR